jgi:hypothetical protein
MSFGQIWCPHRFSLDESAFLGIRAKGKESLREQDAYIEKLLEDSRAWALPTVTRSWIPICSSSISRVAGSVSTCVRSPPRGHVSAKR